MFMNRMRLLDVLLAVFVLLGAVPDSYAGSDRWIMTMTAERMDRGDLVFVRFFGKDGAALESDALQAMVIREQDCSSGHIFEMAKDYKMGYSPKNMFVGIYLPARVWNKKTLCFSVPDLGTVEQMLDPAANNSRTFQLKMAP
jgi:hypothetical protein